MGSDEILNNVVPKDENGVLNGHGVILRASGDIYEGNLKEGLFEGYEEFTWFSCVKYKGNWVRDMKCKNRSYYTTLTGLKLTT